MIAIRHARERGHASYDWLDSRHTFSFANYYDPRFMGFRDLRVINEDRVAPDTGFPSHPHRDMEIFSLVLEGELQHKDSLGHAGVIRAGELQRISAGSGIVHSEWNPSAEEPVHFLQIWIMPESVGQPPDYAQRAPQPGEEKHPWVLLASRDGRDGSLSMRQDVDLWRGRLTPTRQQVFELRPGRHAWLQVIDGDLNLAGRNLVAGDGAAISETTQLQLGSARGADILLFDLA